MQYLNLGLYHQLIQFNNSVKNMLSQKKFKAGKKSQSAHSCSHGQLEQQMKYGPPSIQRPKINETIGYNLPKRPLGLQKHFRTGSNSIAQQQRQSYFDLTLRVGQLNFLKRFKSNRYLDSFSSKKNMYNICEEKTISKLHEQLLHINQQNKLGQYLKFIKTNE